MRRAGRLGDQLSEHEPPYRSRGEAQVGRLLERYDVPFAHEAPTVVHDRGRYRTWHPDFTLPSYGNLVVEYAGMMDVPDYATGIEHKRHAYRVNQIPTLFVYPSDITGPDWPPRLMAKIGQACEHHSQDHGHSGASARTTRYKTSR